MAAIPNPKQSKMVSQSEYNLLEEWAPQTLGDYSCTRKDSSPGQEHKRGVQTLPKKLQRNPSPRRTRQRSSSVYEEWKAQVSCARVNSAVPMEPRTALSDANSLNVEHPASQIACDSHAENERINDHPRVVVDKVISNNQRPTPKGTVHRGK